jgi:sugar lactone lactonase YvrE
VSRVLGNGFGIGESPRWHEGRLWLANWGASEIVAVAPGNRVGAAGGAEVVARVPTAFQFSFDWSADGRLVVIAGRERQLLRQEPDGTFAAIADLTALDEHGWNELVVDGRGNAYVNGGGFDLMAGAEFAPGRIAVVCPDGNRVGAAAAEVREVADGIAFPNGMAVTPDNATLIVAESYAKRLTAFTIGADGGLSDRRVWADLGDGVPDGICIDAEGAVWYADVPNRRCTRVREGGEVLDRVELDRGCFACMLGAEDGRTLFIAAAEWKGLDGAGQGERTGQVVAAPAPAPGAGWP